MFSNIVLGVNELSVPDFGFNLAWISWCDGVWWNGPFQPDGRYMSVLPIYDVAGEAVLRGSISQ